VVGAEQAPRRATGQQEPHTFLPGVLCELEWTGAASPRRHPRCSATGAEVSPQRRAYLEQGRIPLRYRVPLADAGRDVRSAVVA